METQRTPIRIIALVIGICLWLALNIAAMDSYPPATCDEALYSSQTTTFMRGNGWGMEVYGGGDPFYRDLNMVHMSRISTLIEAGIFAITGVQWWAGRLFALLGIAVATGLMYLLGKLLYGQDVGLGAAALFAFSTRTFQVSHVPRPDSWATAFLLLALLGFFHLLRRERRFWFAVMVGVLGWLAFEMHAYMIGFMGGMGLGVLWKFWKTRDWPTLFGYGTGLVIGGALWGGVHFSSYPAQSWYQLTVGYAQLGNLPLSSGPLVNLGTWLAWMKSAFVDTFGPLGLIELILGLIGIGAAVRSREEHGRMLVLILAVSMILFAVAMTQRFVQYAVYWLPLLLILGVTAMREIVNVDWIREKLPSKFSGAFLFSLGIVALVAAQMAGDVWLTLKFGEGSFTAMGDEIAGAVPPNTRVLADATWWWALRDDRTFSESGVLHAIRADLRLAGADASPEAAAAELMRRIQPDYIVADPTESCGTSADDEWDALLALARSDCEQVDVIDGPWVGMPDRAVYALGQEITVYRCDGE